MSEVDINKEFSRREAELSKVMKVCESKLKKAPSGRLKVRNYKGKSYYYVSGGGADSRLKYLRNSEYDKAKQLAQRDYDARTLDAVNRELSAIHSYQKKMPAKTYEQTYDALNPGRKVLITPHFLPDSEFVKGWLEEPYEPYEIEPGVAKHYTDLGEEVRSKSEVMIANALMKAGIPYKYECPLFLGDVKVHPDFTILKMPSRKVVYWEHLGRLDDPGYVERNLLKKIDEYEESGIFLGDGLIITRETAATPLNIKKVMRIIDHYLM
ncbi:hypothetical protein [Butyrivibrio sp. WCD2001]|uniref:hypothetical protein n=1 Tax=Butyrivibrio sp. WCD2001 TaxID=1280681 RepID=UPI00041DFE1E|nr:hypothetical protein [Butyrivibrio sp. WCD2001]